MREDWQTVKLPRLMIQAVDAFLATDIAKKNGMFSRSDLLIRIISSWFSNFEKDFGAFVPREVLRNMKGYDVMRPYTTEESVEDHELGPKGSDKGRDKKKLELADVPLAVA